MKLLGSVQLSPHHTVQEATFFRGGALSLSPHTAALTLPGPSSGPALPWAVRQWDAAVVGGARGQDSPAPRRVCGIPARGCPDLELICCHFSVAPHCLSLVHSPLVLGTDVRAWFLAVGNSASVSTLALVPGGA